jgi:hypothetical protein
MIATMDTLRRAGEILREIEQLQNELAGLFTGGPIAKRHGRPARGGGAGGGGGDGVRKRRKMSPEARARIAAAAKARWARYRAEKQPAAK